MDWKEILKEERIEKAPPFDVQPVAERARMGSLQNLNKLLIQHLDGSLKEQLENKPFQKTFIIPMHTNVHRELVSAAGSQEELETLIKEQYNLEEFFIKQGATRYTQGQMAYHFKVR
tara:strand:+ start:80 stop:430 length:351 start_codon:yes stop_codon:yes gene_type:complete